MITSSISSEGLGDLRFGMAKDALLNLPELACESVGPGSERCSTMIGLTLPRQSVIAMTVVLGFKAGRLAAIGLWRPRDVGAMAWFRWLEEQLRSAPQTGSSQWIAAWKGGEPVTENAAASFKGGTVWTLEGTRVTFWCPCAAECRTQIARLRAEPK